MLSVILPTYNRSGFLFRLLAYYKKIKLKHRIIVADASDPADLARNAATVNFFRRDLRVGHRIYPPSVNFWNKVNDALAQVDTPCTVLAADDDFFVASTLERAAAFLESNPDYSAVHGRAAAFFLLDQPAVFGGIRATCDYKQRSIEQASPEARLRAHLNDYSTTWYSVHRTMQLKQALQVTENLKLDINFSELLPSCMTLIWGKVKKLDGLYLVRQSHAAKSYTVARNWTSAEDWESQYARVRDCLAEELHRCSGIQIESARASVNEVFALYLLPFRDPVAAAQIAEATTLPSLNLEPFRSMRIRQFVEKHLIDIKLFGVGRLLASWMFILSLRRKQEQLPDEMAQPLLEGCGSRFRADFAGIKHAVAGWPFRRMLRRVVWFSAQMRGSARVTCE